MRRFDVRRLTALDLHGLRGGPGRRRVVLVEFVLGVVACGAVGILALATGGVTNQVIGVLLLGAAVNYLPLAGYAVMLFRPGALQAELEGVDVRAELRYYTGAQALILVPAAVALLALVSLVRGRDS